MMLRLAHSRKRTASGHGTQHLLPHAEPLAWRALIEITDHAAPLIQRLAVEPPRRYTGVRNKVAGVEILRHQGLREGRRVSDQTPNTLHLLSGLPRSGKSTWAREQMRAHGWPIVSGDATRRVIYHRRFWLPGEPLVHAHLRTMVKALFIAGHCDVILDEAVLDKAQLDSWRCHSTGTTERSGGSEYRSLFSVDLNNAASDDDLQGDVIFWRRHLVVIPTTADECLRRAKDLVGYNQLGSLVRHIERCANQNRLSKEDLEVDECFTVVELTKNVSGSPK